MSGGVEETLDLGLEKGRLFRYDKHMECCKVIKVTAAVIRRDNTYLICRRVNGLWEFPGGKVEPGETPQQGLARECREELSIEILVGRILDTVCVPASDGRTLEIQFYEAVCYAGEPVVSVHTEVRYVPKELLAGYSFCAADHIFLTHDLL